MGKKKEKKVKEKKVKEKKEKGKSGKKKILLILIPIILVLAAGSGLGAFLYMTRRSPENYWDEKEKVDSVTEVVGDRKCKLKKKDDTVTYTYNDVKDSKADVDKYVKYLQEQKEFGDIEIPDTGEGDEKSESEESDGDKDKKDSGKDKEDKEDKKDKDDEEDKDGGNEEPEEGTHYELGADSTKDGKLLKVTIDVKEDSYVIKVMTGKGTLKERQELIEEKLAKAEKAHSLTEAVDKIQALSQTQLEVSLPPDQLTFVPSLGRLQIEDKDYYKVTAYSRGVGGVTCYEGSYLADCRTLKDLFKYNEQTQECTPIK